MKTPFPLYASMGTTIFETMSRLSEAHGAINLGQGFPDEDGPAEIKAAAARALETGWNQYTTMWGLPALRQALARHEAEVWGLSRDWQSEVLVTAGATEALSSLLTAWCAPEDEVIVFEPVYDAYLPLIRRAGARPVPVRLEAPAFRLDVAQLRAALSPRTKAILLNNPANPCARVFDEAELQAVAGVAQEADLLVICDEVYEHLAFSGSPHRPLATLPGMNERCLKVGSAGKMFSLTGWRLGWVTGPAALLAPVVRAHQFLTFCQPPPLQAAIAHGLDACRPWLRGLGPLMEAKRDQLAAELTAAGLKVLPSQGTYFVNVSLAGTRWEGQDLEFCRHLTQVVGVAAVPGSPFYVDQPERNLVRFCFSKKTEVLAKAGERLRQLAL